MTEFTEKTEEQRGVVSVRNPLDGTKAEIVARPNIYMELELLRLRLSPCPHCGQVGQAEAKHVAAAINRLKRKMKGKRL